MPTGPRTGMSARPAAVGWPGRAGTGRAPRSSADHCGGRYAVLASGRPDARASQWFRRAPRTLSSSDFLLSCLLTPRLRSTVTPIVGVIKLFGKPEYFLRLELSQSTLVIMCQCEFGELAVEGGEDDLDAVLQQLAEGVLGEGRPMVGVAARDGVVEHQQW